MKIPEVYLVITDHGISGAYFDEGHAYDRAEIIQATVVAIPIRADYRPHPLHGRQDSCYLCHEPDIMKGCR